MMLSGYGYGGGLTGDGGDCGDAGAPEKCLIKKSRAVVEDRTVNMFIVDVEN